MDQEHAELGQRDTNTLNGRSSLQIHVLMDDHVPSTTVEGLVPMIGTDMQTQTELTLLNHCVYGVPISDANVQKDAFHGYPRASMSCASGSPCVSSPPLFEASMNKQKSQPQSLW